ncbi:TonB-dependent receptor [Aureivirga sp. CE67]|uniref:TonB-dependent receptor n=1 Tax=Aureivirga sp. CE67 TaxID=1788983 RepID=UPI0018CAB399|nr:TonB-dependent receptor [Aureivirga sp. CE67]
MKKYLIILFLGIQQVLFAQEKITGNVNDENGNPVESADVYLVDLERGTTTNLEGFFEIENVPAGAHTLSISFVGYETQTLNVKAGDNVNVTLKEAIFNIDEVIVSTPFQKLQRENVLKIDRIGLQEIQKNGAPTLIEGITALPGVSQISTGNGIGKPVIRGLSGNRVIVYTQGIRLENQQFGGEHGLGVNDAGIADVEVIKGPASLLYGSDALGGVLYLKPEKFAPENKTQFNFQQQLFSNTQGSSSSLAAKTSTKHFKFLARGTYDVHHDYKLPSGDYVLNSRFNEKDFKTGLGISYENFSSTIRYNFNETTLGLPSEIVGSSSGTTPFSPYQKINNHIISALNTFYFDKSKLFVNLGYTINKRKEIEAEHDHGHEEHEEHDGHAHEEEQDEEHEEHEEEIAAIDLDLRTFTYEAKYQYSFENKIEAIVGVQGLNQENKNYGPEILIPDATVNDLGAFSTVLIPLGKHSLQAGVRFDSRNIKTKEHHIEHEDGHDEHEEHTEEEGHEEEEEVLAAIDKSFTSFTASLGAKFALSPKTTIRVNVASGFRAPNLAELTSNGVHHGANRYEIGNANLKTEKNIQTDLSFEYGNKHIEFYANGFINLVNDYIHLDPTNEELDGAPVFEYVQNNARLYGGEVGFHLHPHPLDWLHLYSSYETVLGQRKNDEWLALIPANKWQNQIKVDIPAMKFLEENYISLNVNHSFAQNKVSQFETSTSDYTLVNFGLGTNIKQEKWNVNVFFSINNLFDKEYIPHLSRLKTENIPNPGRNFVLGLNFNI